MGLAETEEFDESEIDALQNRIDLLRGRINDLEVQRDLADW